MRQSGTEVITTDPASREGSTANRGRQPQSPCDTQDSQNEGHCSILSDQQLTPFSRDSSENVIENADEINQMPR